MEAMKLYAYFENGDVVEQNVENDCQIWRAAKSTFQKDPKANVLVKTADGVLLRDLTYVKTARGMTMVNSVKKAKTTAAEKKSSSRAVKKGGCIFITA